MAIKLVTAVIKPHQLDAVKEALHALGVAGLRCTGVLSTLWSSCRR
jgi:nitrogen regulatory protein PII